MPLLGLGLEPPPLAWVSEWPSSLVGDTAKAECPPRAPREGTLLISYPGRGSMSRPLLPPKLGHHGLFWLQPAGATTLTWANCVSCLLLTLLAHLHPVTKDCPQLPVHPPNLKISPWFKIICYTDLKATGKEIFPNNEIKIDVFRKLCVLECVNLTHLVKYWSH